MTHKVLVAEDEPALLDCYCELVAHLGHTCLRAQDGNEALSLARKQQPDLVVTDLMMPGRTGLELIRALRADPALNRVPVILLSAARPSAAEKGEAWRFLPKPVSIETFEAAVREGVEAGRQLDTPQSFRAGADELVSPLSLAREAMLSWVAHEIKSPLAAALMAAELASRAIENEEVATLRKRLAIISRQLGRMDELVTSILDAARLQEEKLELDLEDIDLGTWVRHVVDYWRELHADYSFPVSDGDTLLVSADRERLRQILDNLISNAIKYGGTSKVVRIGIRATQTHAYVSVTDDGKGIEPDELPHIFDRFHRVAGQGGRGHGLGLFIAAALARLHGGELTVESQLYHGSTFTLELPRKLGSTRH